MRELLPYFENELTLLRHRGQSFSQAYPRIAGKLLLGADEAKDPHVERMIESFALLAARVHKRLDDDFPLFTEALLNVLYPHYLRPFPSCSIAQFDLGASASQMSKPVVVERGTKVSSRQIKGVACRFTTSQEVQLLPLRIASVSYRNSIVAPESTKLPAGATSVISISLELLSPQVSWGMLANQPLRVYLDGEPSQISVLREVLCHKVLDSMVQTQMHHPWLNASTNSADGGVSRPQLVGFGDDEALFDVDVRSHPAYRLLTEYFAFPEKFNFVDLPVPVPNALRTTASGVANGDVESQEKRLLTLHLLVCGIRSDSDEARLLESISARNFQLGCTPVINLFAQPADPIRVTHAAAAYPVVVDARRAFAYEIYSLDRVFRVKKTQQGESVQEFRPFFSLQHDDLLGSSDSANEPDDRALYPSAEQGAARASGCYWSMQRDEDVAALSPGYEFELSIVDVDFNPASPQTDTLSLNVTATNRDLPSLLPFGVPGGDLFMEGGGAAKEIRLLRKPTQTQRFERGRGALWRLISHLSLNHLSLSGGGIDALKEMLRLYDLPRSATNRRQIDGLVAIEFKPATAWLPGEPYATFVRGTEIRLTIDEDSFVGSGLGLFAAVLDHFFGLYVNANSFTKLTLISARTQEELHSCPPRNGDMPLV
jgi:type VI secretion system protein ImpG